MIGKLYGKYELLEKIGQGGMAELFLARHSGISGFKKQVALKMIHPSLASAADSARIVQMFLDEARLAAHLDHPHIVQIYELGEADGHYFIAMEYVDGVDLARVGQLAFGSGQPIPIHHAVKIMSFVCEALAFAHQACDSEGQPLHLVHRDVSPQNVLLGFNGSVKLTDFGVAKATLQVVKTEIGSIKGKLGYMSPEQIRAEPLDGRSDIFGAGILLYEITTGRRPFSGESEMSILEAIVSDPPPPPSALRSDYPPELAGIVERALAKRPEDRFQDALEMQMALEQLLLARRAVSNASLIARYARELVESEGVVLESALEQTVPGVEMPGLQMAEQAAPARGEDEEHTVRTPMPPLEPPTLPRIVESAGIQITERAPAPDPASLESQPTDEGEVFASTPRPLLELEKIAPLPPPLAIEEEATTRQLVAIDTDVSAETVTDPRATAPAAASAETGALADDPEERAVDEWHPPTDRVVPLSGGGGRGNTSAPAETSSRRRTAYAIAVAAAGGCVVVLLIALMVRMFGSGDHAPPQQPAVVAATLIDAGHGAHQALDADPAAEALRDTDPDTSVDASPDTTVDEPGERAVDSPLDAATRDATPDGREAADDLEAETRAASKVKRSPRARASVRAAESVQQLCQEGNRAMLQGRFEQASELFERAYRKNPRSVEARRGLDLAYKKLGRVEMAERYCMTANRMILRGDSRGAIKLFKLALESDFRAADAHRGLGIAYGKTGAARDAVRHYKAYLAARPNARDADEVRDQISTLQQNSR